jgi:transcriptional antiterminator NusG
MTMIFGVRTTVGREATVMSMIRRRGEGIKAILHPAKVKGYILVEGDEDAIRKAVSGLRHSKGMIPKPTTLSEIEHFIETREIEIEVAREDIIEIVGGPFKGERGKVIRVDKAKAEVTIELLETTVPIPVTVGVGSVRVLEKREK